MMADYCSNMVTFTGNQQQLAVEHFAEMGYDAPPFYAILIDDNAVYFESRWIPPQKDLNEIAELFDVSYDIVYRLPNERKKESYHYDCMNDEPLRKIADNLRLQIREAADQTALGPLENLIHAQGDLGKINFHERSILTQVLGKKYRSFTGRDNPSVGGKEHTFKGLGR